MKMDGRAVIERDGNGENFSQSYKEQRAGKFHDRPLTKRTRHVNKDQAKYY